jgi:hypothetical protein
MLLSDLKGYFLKKVHRYKVMSREPFILGDNDFFCWKNSFVGLS